MRKILVLFFGVSLISCESGNRNEKSTGGWHGAMRGLAQSLNEIMPDLIARSPFETKLEEKELQRALKSFQKFGRDLNTRESKIPSRDPSLRFMVADFKKELNAIQEDSRSQSLNKTRAQMHRLTSYCISCHTRVKASSSFFTGDMGQSIAGYSDFGKARFYTSVRQYEKAMVHYEKALTDKNWGKSNPKSWNQSAMALLVITVRVQEDPNLTVEMLSRLFDSDAYPPSIEKAARIWKQDAVEWEKETSKNYELDHVQTLLRKATERNTRLEGSGLLMLLRASKAINRLLDQNILSGLSQQRQLFYSGLVAQKLEALEFATFPKSYFQACISVDPSSNIAQQCKQNL